MVKNNEYPLPYKNGYALLKRVSVFIWMMGISRICIIPRNHQNRKLKERNFC